MTTTAIKVKVQRTPQVKAKMLPQFPVAVSAASPILLTKNGVNYTFSFDENALTLALGTIFQPLDATLTALAALNSTAGLLVETAADTFAKRTLTGTANQITVTNGDGSVGNPTISIPSNAALPGSPTTTTQPTGDNSNKIATDAFVLANALQPTNNLSDVADKGVAARNLGPTNINLSGSPSGSSPRVASYGDLERICFGQEYLGCWIHSWRNGTGVGNGIVLRGDSTMVGQGKNDANNVPELLFQRFAAKKGLRALPVNRAVTGTTTADWINTHLPSDLAGTAPLLYILNYGTNDITVGISAAQTIANLRSGFSSIRGSTWTPDVTAVVYMMPYSGWDDANGRNETWRESVAQQIKQACRDYGIVFFDTYAALRDARNNVMTGWTDSFHIHPVDEFYATAWGLLVDAVIPKSVELFACQPAKVTPASGYTFPGTAEDMQTAVNGEVVIGNGFIFTPSAASIAVGTTLATVSSYHTPLTQAQGIQMASYNGSSFQFFHGTVSTGGVVATAEAVTNSPTRIYFGPSIWKH